MSLYVSEFVGTNYLFVGTLMSTIGLIKAGMGPLSGFLSDKQGRKIVATLGAFCIALSLLLSSIATSHLHLIFSFILYGLGQSFFFLAIMTSMVEIGGPNRRALTLGLYESINGFSILIGSYFSKALVTLVSMKQLFLLATGFSFLSFLGCNLLIIETQKETINEGVLSIFKGLRNQLNKEYITAMYSAFLFMYMHSLYSTIIPLYSTLTVKVSIEFLPILFIVYSGFTALGSIIGGPVSDKMGRKLPLFIGMLICALSFASLIILKSQTALLLSSITLGFGGGFYHPVASAIVADLSKSSSRGRYFGFYRMVRDLGTFAGPAISGIVSSLFGVPVLFGVSVILTLAAGSLALFVIKETIEIS